MHAVAVIKYNFKYVTEIMLTVGNTSYLKKNCWISFEGRDFGVYGISKFNLFIYLFVAFDLNKRWTGVENIMGQMIQLMMEQWYDFEACHLVAAKKRLFSFSKVPLV